MYFAEYPSPLGTLLLTSEENALTGLWMGKQPPEAGRREDHPVLQQAMQWLDGYFRGEVQPIPFPLNPQGTPFQKQVWQLLLTIPYGATRSYGDIAREMALLRGKKNLCIAVTHNITPLPVLYHGQGWKTIRGLLR